MNTIISSVYGVCFQRQNVSHSQKTIAVASLGLMMGIPIAFIALFQ